MKKETLISLARKRTHSTSRVWVSTIRAVLLFWTTTMSMRITSTTSRSARLPTSARSSRIPATKTSQSSFLINVTVTRKCHQGIIRIKPLQLVLSPETSSRLPIWCKAHHHLDFLQASKKSTNSRSCLDRKQCIRCTLLHSNGRILSARTTSGSLQTSLERLMSRMTHSKTTRTWCKWPTPSAPSSESARRPTGTPSTWANSKQSTSPSKTK